MKTKLADGTEYNFSIRYCTGFISGDTIEINAEDVNEMVRIMDHNPWRFASMLNQLQGRFPDNRVGGKNVKT